MDSDPARRWYHGSPFKLTTIQKGSTVTQKRQLARVFSHKPTLVSVSDDGQTKHNGTVRGYLYVIVERIGPSDVIPHPHTTMAPGDEWLTTRDLRVQLLCSTKPVPEEQFADVDISVLQEQSAGQRTNTTMQKILAIRTGWALIIFAFLDLFCVGMGMGVPFLCILFGLPVGWYIAQRVATSPLQLGQILHKMLAGAVLTSAFTFVVMTLLWGRFVGMLFDPAADLANVGNPLILYEPMPSVIGWLVLMIVVSPFLQLLMTLFGTHVGLLRRLGKKGGIEEAGEHEVVSS
jgi:hypothetical protein